MFKKLTIILVALFAFAGTVSAYGWWDTLQEEQLGQTLTIGEGTDLSVTVNASAEAGQTLVPAEALLGDNDTKTYTFTYDLVLSKQLTTDATLTAVVSNITVGGVANPGSAITVVVSYDTQAINADSVVVVTLTVTMANPVDQAQYDLLANQAIAFDVTFNAS